ncbi:MAG: hypothetical protein IJW25_03560, partial [Clostridia bacterium]|nr:hypothetical protein [Clostridia bacterium]
NNYYIDFTGYIEIIPADIKSPTIIWETTYNGYIQNVVVENFKSVANNTVYSGCTYSVINDEGEFNGAVKAGTYTNVTVTITYGSNYNPYIVTGDFVINKKALDLNFTATQIFDGDAFTYYLQDSKDEKGNSVNAIDSTGNTKNLTTDLCSGHTFNGKINGQEFKSYIRTTGSYLASYMVSKGSAVPQVKIFNSSGTDVTSNYDISYTSTVLNIGLETVLVEVTDSYTYNGENQTIRFKLFKEQVSLAEGADNIEKISDYQFKYSLTGGQTVNISYQRVESANVTAISQFKYAATYTVTLTSSIFNEYKFNIVIAPKTITNVRYSTTTKVYDGTNVYNGTITSTDIYEQDSAYIKLTTTYGKSEVCSTYFNSIVFNNVNDGSFSDRDFELLCGSYTIGYIIDQVAQITPREVTFTYNKAKDINAPYYYNAGNYLTLMISAFNINNQLNTEKFDESFEGFYFNNNISKPGNYNLYDFSSDLINFLYGDNENNINLNNYTLKFAEPKSEKNPDGADLVEVQKAEVTVKTISGTTVTYHGEAGYYPDLAIEAKIHDGHGALKDEIKKSVLTFYITNKDGERTDALHVGEYLIVPQIASGYEDRYTYISKSESDYTYTITPYTTKLEVDASILYDPTLANKEQAVFSLEYLNASATLVQNESFTGTLSVSKEK